MSVTVYGTSHCPQCRATRRQLDRLGVPYRGIDVEDDAAAREQLRAAGYRQVPVVVTDGGIWSGYRPDLLRALAERLRMRDCDCGSGRSATPASSAVSSHTAATVTA